jgi:DNA-binding MltR family transcriptional regulator
VGTKRGPAKASGGGSSTKKEKNIPPTFDRINEDVREVFNGLRDKSDRDLALSVVALLDDTLNAAFRRVLLEDESAKADKKVIPALMGAYRPLSSLSAKIDFAFALGWIGPKLRATLHAMRDVRNQFAHRYSVDRFTHPEIREACLRVDLGLPLETMGCPPSDRERFWLTALLVCNQIQLNVLAVKAPEPRKDYTMGQHVQATFDGPASMSAETSDGARGA